ncbi:GDP-mannose 4,6-dehydratase [candidate division KSB1 bacterium]|nr:GDP-mannose 4,6-dehydratase [candidate division KSB1 bacterium]
MKCLITGGAGFIGSHLSERLLECGYEVVNYDDFNDYYDPNIKRRNIAALVQRAGYTLVEGDILDREALQQLFKQHQFSVVVHLAARAGVRPSIAQPLLYEQVNCEGTVNLLELVRHSGVDKFIFGSSSSVYGENAKVPFSEEDRVDHPISPYASTKKAGELICYTYHHLYKMKITCLRFFTVYGPRQRPDMAIHKFTKMIDAGEKVPMFGEGTSRRDYTYISDIVDGIEKAMHACSAYHIYNLGESRTIDLRSLIHLIQEALGKKALIEQLPLQPGDVPITYADISKARREIGYDPKVDVAEGVRRFVEWFKQNSSTRS